MSDAGQKDGGHNTDKTVVYQSCPDTHGAAKLSTSILEALDSIPGYDIENSDTVVFDHVDLDALDELFTQSGGTSRQGTVTFPVSGYQVTVTAAGEVTIRTQAASGS